MLGKNTLFVEIDIKLLAKTLCILETLQLKQQAFIALAEI